MTTARTRYSLIVVALALLVALIAACNRIVDLTPGFVDATTGDSSMSGDGAGGNPPFDAPGDLPSDAPVSDAPVADAGFDAL